MSSHIYKSDYYKKRNKVVLFSVLAVITGVLIIISIFPGSGDKGIQNQDRQTTGLARIDQPEGGDPSAGETRGSYRDDNESAAVSSQQDAMGTPGTEGDPSTINEPENEGSPSATAMEPEPYAGEDEQKRLDFERSLQALINQDLISVQGRWRLLAKYCFPGGREIPSRSGRRFVWEGQTWLDVFQNLADEVEKIGTAALGGTLQIVRPGQPVNNNGQKSDLFRCAVKFKESARQFKAFVSRLDELSDKVRRAGLFTDDYQAVMDKYNLDLDRLKDIDSVLERILAKTR